MTEPDDDLDRYELSKLCPTPADLEAHAAAQQALKKAKPNGAGTKSVGPGPFVRYPVEVICRLGEAKHIGSPKLYPLLLHLDWKSDHRPFPLPNEALEKLGIGRKQKGLALRELGRMGLIRVEHRDRKSPLVTVLIRASQRKAAR